MRIGAYHQVAGDHQPLLREQHVLDAHAPHLVVVRQLLLAREQAHRAALLCRLDVLVRRKVVGHHHHARRIEHALDAEPRELADGDGRRDIVAEHQVDVDLDKLPGAHLFPPCVGGNDLGSECGAHQISSAARTGCARHVNASDRPVPSQPSAHACGSLKTPAPFLDTEVAGGTDMRRHVTAGAWLTGRGSAAAASAAPSHSIAHARGSPNVVVYMLLSLVSLVVTGYCYVPRRSVIGVVPCKAGAGSWTERELGPVLALASASCRAAMSRFRANM